MSATKRITKTDKIDAIKWHFAKSNKRMTNITKVTMDKLDGLIATHNINVAEYLIVKNNAEIERQEQTRLDEIERQEQKRQREIQELINKEKWNSLTDEQREQCYIKEYELCNDYDEIYKHNNELIRQTDVMEKLFIEEGKRILRTGDNTLLVNGINIINGYSRVAANSTEWISSRKEIDQQRYVYNNKHIIKMIDEFIENNSKIIERVYPIRDAFAAKMKIKKSKIIEKSILDFEIIDE